MAVRSAGSAVELGERDGLDDRESEPGAVIEVADRLRA
jgi:hypothetical protein